MPRCPDGGNRRYLLLALCGLLLGAGGVRADLALGESLYAQHCESCHGMDGRGVMPGTPDLSRPDAMLVPDSLLVEVIENGSGTMPAYLGVLDPREMRAVIAYMRTLIQ